MQRIKLIDATQRGLADTQGFQHVELGYASAEASASFFLGEIPGLGTVRGKICPQCGRIILHGSPSASWRKRRQRAGSGDNARPAR
jgi:hypothetical protein